MRNLNVVYLTWGETPRSYGIYRSQVAETVAEIVARHPDITHHLIAGLPIIHSGLVREKLAYGQELKSLRQTLGDTQLSVCLIPVPQNFVFPKARSFGMIFAGARFTLLPKLRRINPDVVHCRSFLATYLATDLRRRFGLNYKIIYDARSLWPEMQYRNSANADDLAFFRELERDVVADVDVVVGVNDPMSDHYAHMGAKDTITNYIATTIKAMAAPRQRAPKDPIRLIYSGALYDGGMQTPETLFKLAKHVQTLLGPVHLTVLTTSAHSPLRTMAEEYLSPEQLNFKAVRDPEQMPKLLAEADFACNVYRKPVTDIDQMLCTTGLSTKSAEYLGAGLPILVSSYPEAVGRLVLDNDIGCVFDEALPHWGLNQDKLASLMTVDTKYKALTLAQTIFARTIVADRFSDMYRRISS